MKILQGSSRNLLLSLIHIYPDMKLRSYLSGGRLEQDGEWHCEYDGDGNLTERYLGTGKWLDGKNGVLSQSVP